MDFLKKAVDSGAVDKAVDAAVQNKDKVVAAVGDVATKVGLDAATAEKGKQQVEAALADGTQLKETVKAQLGGGATA